MRARLLLDEAWWHDVTHGTVASTWVMDTVMAFPDPPTFDCEPRRVLEGACPYCDVPLSGRDEGWLWLWCSPGCGRFWRLRYDLDEAIA